MFQKKIKNNTNILLMNFRKYYTKKTIKQKQKPKPKILLMNFIKYYTEKRKKKAKTKY